MNYCWFQILMGLPREQYKRNKCCFWEVVAFFFPHPFQEQKNFLLKIQFMHWFMLVTFLLLWQPTITGEVREEKFIGSLLTLSEDKSHWPPPIRPHLLIFPKQFHQLEPKYSNKWDNGACLIQTTTICKFNSVHTDECRWVFYVLLSLVK